MKHKQDDEAGVVEVLVAEDEALLRDLIEAALVEAGFAVVIADSGTAAMQHLKDGLERFSALVTDIRIGAGPDGWEVAVAARESNPALPVVYMSGDSASQWPSKGVPGSVMISKPFVLAQLVTALATLLNESGAAP